MNLLMTATPLAMNAGILRLGHVGVQWHVIGMLHLVFHRALIKRFGLIQAVTAPAHLRAWRWRDCGGELWLALLLLGVGWNSCSSADDPLTETYQPSKAQAQGSTTWRYSW